MTRAPLPAARVLQRKCGVPIPPRSCPAHGISTLRGKRAGPGGGGGGTWYGRISWMPTATMHSARHSIIFVTLHGLSSSNVQIDRKTERLPSARPACCLILNQRPDSCSSSSLPCAVPLAIHVPGTLMSPGTPRYAMHAGLGKDTHTAHSRHSVAATLCARWLRNFPGALTSAQRACMNMREYSDNSIDCTVSLPRNDAFCCWT